jgi:hypothetical protein
VTYPTSPSLAPNDTLTYGSPGTSAPGADSQFGADDLFADTAGETIGTTPENTEPTGPNSPLATDVNGNQLYYGPGFNLDIDRPAKCGGGVTTNCVSGEVLGDGGTTSSATRTDSSGISNSASQVTDNSIVADDTGREIVGATIGGSAVTIGTSAYNTDFGTSAVYVGEVTQNGPAFPTSSGGSTLSGGSFQLIDDNGNPITPTGGSLTSVTLSGECDPATTSGLTSTCTGNQTPDPIFDATDATTGGGDTGSVLISPYITPGTVSTVDYNHYSWLRTMEDLFDVSSCAGAGDITVDAGTVCDGLDGSGHLGYAAQVNLADFGSDVFTAPSGNGFQPLSPPVDTPESPWTIGLPITGLVVIGGVLLVQRRRRRVSAAS